MAYSTDYTSQFGGSAGMPYQAGVGSVFASSLLPAITNALGATMGKSAQPIVSALGNIPGLLLGYQSQASAAEEANKQRMEAANLVGQTNVQANLTPFSGLMLAAADPRRYVAQDIVAGAKASNQQKKLQGETIQSQMSSRGMAPEAIESAINAANVKQENTWRDQLAGVLENARKEVVNRLLSVTGSLTNLDQERIQSNVNNTLAKLGLQTQVLLSPLSTADASQTLAAQNAYLQGERSYALQQQQLRQQAHATTLAAQNAWLGGGMNLAGSLGAAGIGAYGMMNMPMASGAVSPSLSSAMV